jgi:hypothetical protein
MMVKTANERVRVDLSRVGQRPQPGDRVAVVGVMGPERQLMRAESVQSAAKEARPENIPPAAIPTENRNSR